MWYGIYDRLLYALAFLEFKRGYVPVDGFHPTERYGSYATCNEVYFSSRPFMQWLSMHNERACRWR